MKSNYDILGNHIRLIDTRNRESITDRVLGINIDKFFMPSVANVIGTDLSKYKLITKGNLQVDLILLLDEFGYPPVTIDDVYKEVLEQAENFKKYAQ